MEILISLPFWNTLVSYYGKILEHKILKKTLVYLALAIGALSGGIGLIILIGAEVSFVLWICTFKVVWFRNLILIVNGIYTILKIVFIAKIPKIIGWLRKKIRSSPVRLLVKFKNGPYDVEFRKIVT